MATRTELRVALGRVGIRASLDAIPIGDVLDFASAVEDRAFGATGDAAALRGRVTSLGEAGADHVAVTPLSAAGRQASLETAAAVAPDPREWAGPGVAKARPGL